jgi:hypothetical protein
MLNAITKGIDFLIDRQGQLTSFPDRALTFYRPLRSTYALCF